ncbi:MAG: NUDIX hydrolase [Pseudomonadota bacterium]|nr:NUDIX hydrolase [Pseudomonadota bacterium]
MIKSRLMEETLNSENVWHGSLLDLRIDKVRLPNGKETVREYVLHPGAVMIIPLLENGHIVLIRQHRYPLHRDFIELPAGKFDEGEDWLGTGQRELLEETGYTADYWAKLTTIYPCIGYSNEKIVLACAKGLHLAPQIKTDHDEFLEIFNLTLQEALKMIHCGEIDDAKTMAGLLWLATFNINQVF